MEINLGKVALVVFLALLVLKVTNILNITWFIVFVPLLGYAVYIGIVVAFMFLIMGLILGKSSDEINEYLNKKE